MFREIPYYEFSPFKLEILSDLRAVFAEDLLRFIKSNVPPVTITPTWTTDPARNVKAPNVRPSLARE